MGTALSSKVNSAILQGVPNPLGQMKPFDPLSFLALPEHSTKFLTLTSLLLLLYQKTASGELEMEVLPVFKSTDCGSQPS